MNATEHRKALDALLVLPASPTKVSGLVQIGRLPPTAPAVSDTAADARAALFEGFAEVEVDGFGSVKTLRSTVGGVAVFCTYASRVVDGNPPKWRGIATSRVRSSAASAHLWAVCDLLDDAKVL